VPSKSMTFALRTRISPMLGRYQSPCPSSALFRMCPAALCVREKPIDGHADWYLPSICEISATAVNVPESLTKANCYWSSTYQGYNTACNYRFALETANTSADVSSIRRVRPFRRIPLGLLHA
jgi:hypothetical protein